MRAQAGPEPSGAPTLGIAPTLGEHDMPGHLSKGAPRGARCAGPHCTRLRCRGSGAAACLRSLPPLHASPWLPAPRRPQQRGGPGHPGANKPPVLATGSPACAPGAGPHCHVRRHACRCRRGPVEDETNMMSLPHGVVRAMREGRKAHRAPCSIIWSHMPNSTSPRAPAVAVRGRRPRCYRPERLDPGAANASPCAAQ